MSRYARRVDENHAELLAAIRALGWYVLDTSHIPEFFDAIIAKHARTCFIEIKDGRKSPSRRRLTPAQIELHADFRRAGAEVLVLEKRDDLAQLERPARADGLTYDELQLRGKLA